ncbi:efflux RND transporter periplasmic adaptor subunit [Microbulbifer sp. OS29]|uniref:Efflux RND transporter periplasmic adaptor subunit n=1 Tax=Microbulbifer okhotskensis TaxID=2926617 RepID=A0A9X2J487_9GAMM|nr:efflux RND transporter periplasmic adaptor subunit [Microbulbifer okhotskensis]MCO1333074.1 efflux RND transporter periplasmic adaptor subunit [Microbulbifer okhotskensis]
MSRDTSALLGQLKIDRETAPEPKSSSRKILLAASVGIITGIVIGLAGASLFAEDKAPVLPQNREPQANTLTLIPREDKFRETILNASGYITPRRMATVSAEVMGLISSVDVEEGMQVEEGQVLARLDDAKARVALDFAQAQILVLQAQQASIHAKLKEAERQYRRFAGLRDKNYSSKAQLTQSEASVEGLRADLNSAQANIQVAVLEAERQRERLADHTIRAPFAGVVTTKNAQPGEIVAPSSAGGGFTRTGICTIVDMSSLEIEVDVNEAFIGRVAKGQKVNANLDAYPNWNIPATVIAIIPTADRAKATVRVRIAIDNKDVRILPDMGVKVGFLAGEVAAP